MDINAEQNRRRPACGWFTWGRWLPRRPGRRAVTILQLSYGLGFALPIIGAIQSLIVTHHGGHATPATDSIAVQLINDAVPLAVSLLGATLGMRTAARQPLNLTRTVLGLRAATT